MWSQRQSNLKAGAALLGGGRHKHMSTLSDPQLSPPPRARGGKGQTQVAFPTDLCWRSQSKSFHHFAASASFSSSILNPQSPSFSNYLPNEASAINRYQHRNPGGWRKEQASVSVHETEVFLRWVCGWGRNDPCLSNVYAYIFSGAHFSLPGVRKPIS